VHVDVATTTALAPVSSLSPHAAGLARIRRARALATATTDSALSATRDDIEWSARSDEGDAIEIARSVRREELRVVGRLHPGHVDREMRTAPAFTTRLTW